VNESTNRNPQMGNHDGGDLYKEDREDSEELISKVLGSIEESEQLHFNFLSWVRKTGLHKRLRK
jgi:hypothetical protein